MKRFIQFAFLFTMIVGLSTTLVMLPAMAQTSPIETPVITSTVESPIPEPQPDQVVSVPDNLPMPFALFVLGIFGALVALIQEKTGQSWKSLSPEWKQAITFVTTLVLPTVINFLTPVWRPEFGDVSQFVYAVAWFVGPVVAFLAGQVWHKTVNK